MIYEITAINQENKEIRRFNVKAKSEKDAWKSLTNYLENYQHGGELLKLCEYNYEPIVLHSAFGDKEIKSKTKSHEWIIGIEPISYFDLTIKEDDE